MTSNDLETLGDFTMANRVLVNMTQHTLTTDQIDGFNGFNGIAGDVYLTLEPNPACKQVVQKLLTFETIPTSETINDRAEKLAQMCIGMVSANLPSEGEIYALIGGAPYLMASLENALRERKIHPVYSFSERQSVETTMPDGTVKKSNVFKHVGFIEV